MSTHTPTPIKAGENRFGSTGHVLYDANGQQIANIFERIADYTKEQSRELAEQLALRFNSHDALLAACRASVSQLETEGYAGTLAHAACVHALKLAEGQECDT